MLKLAWGGSPLKVPDFFFHKLAKGSFAVGSPRYFVHKLARGSFAVGSPRFLFKLTVRPFVQTSGGALWSDSAKKLVLRFDIDFKCEVGLF